MRDLHLHPAPYVAPAYLTGEDRARMSKSTLPVSNKYLIADNGMILCAPPTAIPTLQFNWPDQQYGSWQEVELQPSADPRFLLVRFVACGWYLRVDTVLWLQQRYHEALMLYSPDSPDVDSGWQQAEFSGHTIFFRGPDEGGRIGYTAAFRVVNQDGSDFR
jgi:hypothetical protein